MRKTKFLSALVVSALVGAVTLGSTSSTNAQTDITIGDGSSSTNWRYGHMTSGDTDLYTSDTSQYGTTHSYTDWAGGPMNDTVTLDGGSLVLNHNLGTSHGRLYGGNGSLTLSGGNITLSSNDYIENAVNLAVNSGATLRIDGGSVVLNSDDSILGMLKAENGTLGITSGTHNFGTGSTIANAVNLSVSSGATLGITGGSVAIGAGDTISGAINNSSGNLTFNSNTSVGSLTNSNTSNTAVALGSNTLTVNNGLTNSGKIGTSNTGSLVTKGTSSNTGSISVDSMTVSSGSLTNSGSGAIDSNSMTVNTGATLNNQANIGADGDSLTSFTNNGTTSNNGNIYSTTVTNNNSLTNLTSGKIVATTVENVGGTLTNSGTINTTTYTNQKNSSDATGTTTNSGAINATTLNNSSAFENSAGGTINANTIKNTAGQFVNKGTIGTSTSLNTLNNSSGAKFINENTVHASTVTNEGEYQNSTATSVLNATQFDNKTSGTFINNGTANITTLNNDSSITGDNGSLTIASGGYSNGSIEQGVIELTTGNFDNTGSMTSNTTFTNHATITDTLSTGSLTIAAGSSDGVITQKNISISGAFDNDADINATTLLTNSGSIDNSAKITAKSLTNTGTITGDTGDLEIGTDGGSSTGNISQRNITLKGGTFANGAGMTANTKLTVDAGAQLNNTGTLSAATLENNGGMTNNSTLSANTLTTGAGSVTTNNGSATVYGSTTNGGTLTNASGASFATTNLTNNTGAIINNSGTMSAVGTITNNSQITNSSTGNLSANKIVNNAYSTFTNNGNVASANIENGGSITNNKTILADTIETFAGSETTNNDSITAYVSVTNGGTLTNATGSTLGTATLTNNAGAVFDNDGATTVNGTLTNQGTMTNKTNGTVAANKVVNDTSALLTNNNSISASKIENKGSLTNNKTILADAMETFAGSETINNDSITAYVSVTNGGTLTNATGSTLGTATLTNNAGAVFDNDGTTTVNGTLTNQGTMTNKTNGTIGANKLVNDTSAVITNNNSISASKIENKGSLTNNKTILADTIETFAGSDTTNNDSITANVSVTNGGTFTNNATGNIVTADFTNSAGAVLTNDGTVTSTGIFTNNNLVNNSGEGKGTLNVNNGSNNGPMTQGTLNVASGNTGFTNNNTMTIESALNNAGILNNTSNIFVANTANNANLNNTNTINSTANSTITTDTLTNTNGTMNLTKAKIAVVYQSDDIKGIINVLGTDAATDKTDLSIKGTKPNFAGTMNIGSATDKATLNLKNGNIIEAAALNIASGSVLNVDDGGAIPSEIASVVLDSANDTYAGDLTLVSGAVTMKDLTVTTGDTSTTTGGTLPYYEQTGGALTLTNSKLSMVDSSLISDGDLTVDTNSTFNSLSKSFSVSNLTNAGLINGINGGYENYAVSTGFYAGDALGDKQGDFTTDLYARSNANKNYDTYGSDSATIYASDPSKHGILNVSDWTLNGDIYGWDAPIDRNISMDKLFKGSVAAGHTIDFTSTNKEVLTPIGWYGLHSAGNGNYSFGLNRFNPQVFRGQVTKIAQYQNQLMIDDMLFNHTMLDQGFKGNDYIASNPNRLASAGDLFPPYQYSRKDGGLWVKMYGTFEKLQMNQGFKVENNAYGAILGADFGLKELRNGWQFMPTAYIAYNGAHQNFAGTGAYQNGGQAGFLGTWYKNDFMIGALAYGGVYGNDMDTPRGNDQTLGYFAGGAVKTAYNWRFAKDWSLQPNFLVAYNFFGKENWHSDFGQMGMMSGMLNGINIAPGVNLIWEKETFSIYGTLQYMYNINQSVGGRAGNVGLPNVHMDRGYLQYGIGFNKRFSDRFSGFFQAVIRNVGRNGIGLQAGLQWQLGKGGTGEINGKTPELKKSEIILHNQKIQ